jgi:hypothetical protein
LWLVEFWLLFSDRLPRNSSEAGGYVLARLFELGGLMGRAAVVAAVSFGAYLFGSLIKFVLPPWFLAPPVFLSFWPNWMRDYGWHWLPRSYRTTANELSTRRKDKEYVGSDVYKTIRDA